MTKEALTLALEALEEAHYKIEHKQDVVKREQAITAIKEALMSVPDGAQPEQKPVGEVGQIDIDEDGVGYAWFTIATDGLELGDKLYTTPPQRTWVNATTWRGLTDEETAKMRRLIDWTAPWSYGTFARAIEAKLKEKNT